MFLGLVISFNAFAEWKVIQRFDTSSDYSGELIIKSDSIKRNGDVVSLISMISYDKFQPIMRSQSTSYDMNINCKKGERRTLIISTFRGARGEGLIEARPLEEGWQQIDGASANFKKIFSEICNVPISSLEKKKNSQSANQDTLREFKVTDDESCKRVTTVTDFLREQVATTLGVAVSSIRPLRSEMIYVCHIILDTPKGPYACPLDSIKQSGNLVYGVGYPYYRCQRR